MQLTRYTDYSLRVLLYLAVMEGGGTISEIAASYNISRNHLVKVAHQLGKEGYVATTRGRSGGLQLGQDPGGINLGEVVRRVEPNFHLVECFNTAENRCVITPACTLTGVLAQAHRAFFAVLDQYTLKDLLDNKDELRRLLSLRADALRN
ncbi:MAG: Rrf2 family transcriptional regulator [Candidatus Hydrogenedentes bacterium]|nr:Rrf2 family transcriptional regulator [Candidatus Hydrogenedentota bacterium]